MKPLLCALLLVLHTGCVTTAVHWTTVQGGSASAVVIGSGAEIESTPERLLIRHPKSNFIESIGGLAIRIVPFFL